MEDSWTTAGRDFFRNGHRMPCNRNDRDRNRSRWRSVLSGWVACLVSLGIQGARVGLGGRVVSRSGGPFLLGGWLAAAVLASPALGQLLDNPGFESGVSPWFGTGTASLSLNGDARSGNFSLLVDGRTQPWNAANQDVTAGFESGTTYRFGVWAKPLSFTFDPVVITLRVVDGQGERFIRVAQGFAPTNQWTLIEGTGSVSLSPPVQAVQVYVEGPPAGVSYLIDDATMTPVDGYDWVEVANAGIDEHRKRDLVVRVEDQFGDPVSNATVSIEQTRRGFRFGSAIAASALDNPQYRDYFAERFTMATPENAWKWEATEPFQGAQFYNGADEIRDFCLANDILIHGHNVLWAVDQWVPDWVQNLSGTPLRNAVESRVSSVVGRYAGLVDAWDVNNEMLHGSFFASRLGAGFRAELFGLVHDEDPIPDLYINDYNVITQNRLQDQIDLANSLIAQGAPVHGIGVQGHYSQAVDPYLLRTQLDQLGATGLPVRITEYDYERSGASDAERANSLEAMYRVAYSHPAVDAITMWGFWAGRHWRGEEAALVELDWTINAVGQRFDALLAEWTTDEIVQTDPLGVVASRVFHGAYSVRASLLDGGVSEPVEFIVEPGEEAVEIVVVLATPACGLADIAPPLGVLDSADNGVFIGLVETGDPAADLDGDGLATMLDLIEHLRVFDAGCP